MIQIQYEVKTQLEKLGPYELKVECLKDLNQTIDQVFEILEGSGDTRLLEELCPYFGVVWPAARGLAEYLAALPQGCLQGKTVLELGCGLALPSMIAEKMGAQVVATDFHPEVESLLRKNIQKNQISNLFYRRVNWETETQNPVSSLITKDWIIGSDLLYEQRFSSSLAQTIAKLLKPEGVAIIADPGRPYLQAFVDIMKKQGFDHESKVMKVAHPPGTQEVFVLKFFRS